MIDLLSTYLVSLVVSLAMPSNFYPVLICVIHTNFAFISIGLLILYSCLTNCMVNSYCYCSSNYSAIFFCNPSHDVLLLQPHYTNSLGRNDWYLLFYQYWQVQDFFYTYYHLNRVYHLLLDIYIDIGFELSEKQVNSSINALRLLVNLLE